MTQSEQQRRTVYYSGRVQGVGFRYTTRSIAQRYVVAGYVQNLDDGRVLVVVEGAPDEMNRFLNDLSGTMGRYIRHVDVVNSEASGEFSMFTIQR